MSTNDILVRRAAEAARLEELRRLQAEQAERERQRLGLAQHAVTQLDQRFRELVARRDEAAGRLPDFSLQEPSWPTLSAAESKNSDGVEQYAAKLKSVVNAFERQLQTAIHDAEAILADRLARAEAWRGAAALEQVVRVCYQNLIAACQAVQEKPPALQAFDRPEVDASLFNLQRYITALQTQVTDLQQQITLAHRRLDTRRFGHSVSGSQIDVRSNAQKALANHEIEQHSKSRQALLATLTEALNEAKLNMAELPAGTQILLNTSLEAIEATSQQREHIRRLVARERVQQEQTAQALCLMQAPPDLVHAQPERAERWHMLVQELQLVAAGMAPLSPNHGLEYEQIKLDAQRDVDRRYVETEFVSALREQDFNALSDADGRLIIEDLRHVSVWLEETQALEVASSERGGMATVLELKTDTPLDDWAQDEQVIASVCERLQAASQSSTKVKGEHEVLDRKTRISRGRRPTKLQSFAAQS